MHSFLDFLRKLSIPILAVAALLIIYISYLLLWPANVIEVKTQPIPLNPTELKPGDVAIMTFDYCKNRNLKSRITIELVGETIPPTLSSIRNFETGCHSTHVGFTVPESTRPGHYYMAIEFEYEVNQIRTDVQRFDSVPFQVVE